MKKWLQIISFVFLPLLLLCYGYLARVHIIGLVSLYGGLSVARILIQVYTAHMAKKVRFEAEEQPFAAVVVAVFNEKPAEFRQCLKSLHNQDYTNMKVIVVDDGSDNGDEIKEITESFGRFFQYFRIPHSGKREAMYHAFDHLGPACKVVLTSDSDTVWLPDAASKLIACLLSDKKIGAATGFVDTLNPSVNLLTKMISLRYWIAFEQERASQSFFKCVTCVSGPLGAYRRDIIDRIKHKFVSQTFLGKKCTFGDDRHLTNLVLGLGYQVRYSEAVCLTEAPITLKQFVKQQTRWGKSHWREMLWQFKALPVQPLYLSYDWFISLALPFLLTLSIGHYIYLSVTEGWHYILYLLFTVILMSFIRIMEPLRITKNPAFVLFTFYSFFHLFVLLPVKFYSLATVNVSGWGTRKVGA